MGVSNLGNLDSLFMTLTLYNDWIKYAYKLIYLINAIQINTAILFKLFSFFATLCFRSLKSKQIYYTNEAVTYNKLDLIAIT